MEKKTERGQRRHFSREARKGIGREVRESPVLMRTPLTSSLCLFSLAEETNRRSRLFSTASSPKHEAKERRRRTAKAKSLLLSEKRERIESNAGEPGVR